VVYLSAHLARDWLAAKLQARRTAVVVSRPAP
jgi:hypothetical protein